MTKYFHLQFKIFNRKIVEAGLSSALLYPLLVIGFVGGSFFLFYKTELAPYIYAILALSFVIKLSEEKRNGFLKTIFSALDYRIVRLLENLVITIPFLVFLIYKEEYLIASGLLLLSTFLSVINFNNTIGLTVPTPFGKRPFEFSVGFRKTFIIYPIAYFLTYQAISTNNFNLGIFSLLFLGFVVLSYYLNPEDEYYVWSFNLSPKKFLIRKLKTGLLNFTMLCFPILISLGFFFQEDLYLLLAFLVLCYTYIITIILGKYAAFPYKMALPQEMMLTISIFFPPLLLALIPLFYSQAIQQLKPLLDHD